MDDIIIIISLLVVVVGLGAALVAVLTVMKKSKQTSQIPETTTTATVLGVYSKISHVNANFTSQTVEHASSNEIKHYFVDMVLKGNKKMTFRIKKKMFMELHDGDKGTLTYKNDKLINFVITGSSKIKKSELFFIREQKIGPLVSFYGEALDLGVSVMSKATISCDLSDLKRLFERLPQETSDWFFVLKRLDQTVLQVEREHNDEVRWTIQSVDAENTSILTLKEALVQLEQFFK